LYGEIKVHTITLKPMFLHFLSCIFNNKYLTTLFGRILNQQTATHRVIPSLANLVESITLYFWGLSTQVIKFFNGALYGINIVSVNNCYYGNVTTTVQVESYRAIQGLFCCCIMCCRDYEC